MLHLLLLTGLTLLDMTDRRVMISCRRCWVFLLLCLCGFCCQTGTNNCYEPQYEKLMQCIAGRWKHLPFFPLASPSFLPFDCLAVICCVYFRDNSELVCKRHCLFALCCSCCQSFISSLLQKQNKTWNTLLHMHDYFQSTSLKYCGQEHIFTLLQIGGIRMRPLFIQII